jgi:NAD(P)-dependent dehydrogenase (short-subunit alcohol dehydrogenase family)
MMDTPHIRTCYRDLPPDEVAKIMRQRDSHCPMGRQGTAWDAAHAALFLASEEAQYITGAELLVDGGLTLSLSAGEFRAVDLVYWSVRPQWSDASM